MCLTTSSCGISSFSAVHPSPPFDACLQKSHMAPALPCKAWLRSLNFVFLTGMCFRFSCWFCNIWCSSAVQKEYLLPSAASCNPSKETEWKQLPLKADIVCYYNSSHYLDRIRLITHDIVSVPTRFTSLVFGNLSAQFGSIFQHRETKGNLVFP